MKKYSVNNMEVKEIELEIHPGNYRRRVRYNQKDFDILVVSLQDDEEKRYFAIAVNYLPDTDSIHLIYDPSTRGVRWSPAFLDDVVEDVTTAYKQDDQTIGAKKYPDFDEAWKELTRAQPEWEDLPNRRGANTIVDINDNGISRISSNGIKSSISIDKFRFAYNNLIKNGYIARKDINEQVKGRCSSCIVSVLEKLPFIEETSNPRGLKLI